MAVASFASYLAETGHGQSPPYAPPSVATLTAQLCKLPGIEAAHWVTDLTGDKRRTKFRVRLDTSIWLVRVHPDWAGEVYRDLPPDGPVPDIPGPDPAPGPAEHVEGLDGLSDEEESRLIFGEDA